LALVLLGETAPLAFRRKRPLLVLAIVVASAVVSIVLGSTAIEPFVLLIALYSVAAHTDRRMALRAGLAALAALLIPLLVTGSHGPLEVVFELGFLSLGWVLGAYLGELRGRAARVRREHENEKARAVAEEQARIGRELHDVLAHSLSVMVVQASAAEDVFDADPSKAHEALRSIESTGREALSEIRRVLETVSPLADGEPSLVPQPGLDQLDSLVGQVRRAGLRVAVRIDGPRRDLPPGVDLSAYRVVQEALTNTLKHAGATTATVAIGYGTDGVSVEVTDDGRGPASSNGGGRGLVGMRERVAMFGGELSAGAGASGGFAVRARFPIPETTAS